MPINPHQLQPWKYICEARYKRVNLGVVLNKLSSWVLLAAYILMVSHQSIGHSHAHNESLSQMPQPVHHHGQQAGHHEHHFHVGIFHFLGHLFENFNHGDESGHTYLSANHLQNTRANLAPTQFLYILTFIQLPELVSFSGADYCMADESLSHASQLPAHLTRGPPSIV